MMKYFLSVIFLCFMALSFYACDVQQNKDIDNPMSDNYEEQQEIPEGEIDTATIEIDESSEMLEYEIESVEDEIDQLLEDEN